MLFYLSLNLRQKQSKYNTISNVTNLQKAVREPEHVNEQRGMKEEPGGLRSDLSGY